MPKGYVGTDTGVYEPRANVGSSSRVASVWTERMVEALDARVETGWYSLMDKVVLDGTLRRGWERVQANAGAAGIDRVSIERFEANLDERLRRLGDELKTGTYRPQAVRRVEIPKGDGSMRPLGIPTVGDRVVQAALVEVIEPIFEHQFEDSSYGFRPGRGCKDALRAVQQALTEGLVHVVDADLKSYFDSIPHAALLGQVHRRVKDGSVLRLIERFLQQSVVSEVAEWTPEAGTPQGAVLSPLLANVYLHPLDVAMREAGYRMVRYADDFVVLCRTAEQATAALDVVRRWVANAQLTLHPDKTRLADLSHSGGHFDFLGYRFQRNGSGKLEPTIRPKKLKALRAAAKAITPRVSGKSTAELVLRLNRFLRGVFAYFKHAPKMVLATLDAHVRYRLRRIFAHRLGWRGCVKRRQAHMRWRNAYFNALGLFSMAAARDAFLHSHSRHT
jgi:RNA-directed DNA polymerase